MKKITLFSVILFCALWAAGCANNDLTDNGSGIPASNLVAKAEIIREGESVSEVLFTGDDILWFNGKTKEIRLKNNYYYNQAHSFYYDRLTFFLDEVSMFSLLRVLDINSQIFNVPVFYYTCIENKFYITDGYPNISVLGYNKGTQLERDENMQAIADEWGKFIDFMKKTKKYRE